MGFNYNINLARKGRDLIHEEHSGELQEVLNKLILETFPSFLIGCDLFSFKETSQRDAYICGECRNKLSQVSRHCSPTTGKTNTGSTPQTCTFNKIQKIVQHHTGTCTTTHVQQHMYNQKIGTQYLNTNVPDIDDHTVNQIIATDWHHSTTGVYHQPL